MVEGGGFEPPKVEPADLQSAPFGHSGIPPSGKPIIMKALFTYVNSLVGFSVQVFDLGIVGYAQIEDC
jgi:hypothetical protein